MAATRSVDNGEGATRSFEFKFDVLAEETEFLRSRSKDRIGKAGSVEATWAWYDIIGPINLFGPVKAFMQAT